MRQNVHVVRRSRGRPQVRPDEETRQLVIEAARQEFLANGYAGASMVAVAQRAGVSTKTMYRLIPTKADLFRSVVSDRISRFMLDIDAAALDPLPVEDAFERLLAAYGTLTLNGETIAIYRLVLGESDRFPEIAATFYEVAIGRTTEAMTSWLKRLCDRGLIALEDASTATGMLRGMMIMEPQRAAMLGERAAPDAAEIASRAKCCARLFLDGCRRQKPTG
ncbi:TetR/AcrR family transcriptional regulator [Microvirga massiliensis]|uniref:TetR/AcrR family transcriptional regulator n=1 Tax=Microvirga massiliensis TaxID=1033741 RepID=UPI00062B7C89|nr:TetR/AcrR family transcriptional regulator [Microvirga massiliensis]